MTSRYSNACNSLTHVVGANNHLQVEPGAYSMGRNAYPTLWMCMGHIFKGLWRDTLEQQTKNSERLGFGRVLSISIHLVVHSANFLIVPACHLVLRWEGCGPVPHIDYRQEGWLIMEVFHQRPCNIWKKSAVGLTNRKTCFGSWDLISLVLNLTKS